MSDQNVDMRIIPLVLCGGAGTRLWPASRENRPKQFLKLLGSRSTFQDAITRVADPSSPNNWPNSASKRIFCLSPFAAIPDLRSLQALHLRERGMKTQWYLRWRQTM
jgi:hypothetical protein